MCALRSTEVMPREVLNLNRIRSAVDTDGLLGLFGKGVVYLCLYGSFSNSITATAYWNFASHYRRWKHGKELREFGVPIDPFKFLWVDPDEIERFSRRKDIDYNNDVGRIKGGNWDQKRVLSSDGPLSSTDVENFRNYVVYESFQQHFQSGTPWKETELIQIVHEQIEQGHRCWGSSNREEVADRCDRIDRLYKDMKENGYQTKIDLLGINADNRFIKLEENVTRHGEHSDHVTRTGANPVRGYKSIITNEILVDIGRNGELLFVDGRHRLALAKLLDIEKIPVTVLVRHPKWLQTIKQVWEDPEREMNHPDYRQIQTGGD